MNWTSSQVPKSDMQLPESFVPVSDGAEKYEADPEKSQFLLKKWRLMEDKMEAAAASAGADVAARGFGEKISAPTPEKKTGWSPSDSYRTDFTTPTFSMHEGSVPPSPHPSASPSVAKELKTMTEHYASDSHWICVTDITDWLTDIDKLLDCNFWKNGGADAAPHLNFLEIGTSNYNTIGQYHFGKDNSCSHRYAMDMAKFFPLWAGKNGTGGGEKTLPCCGPRGVMVELDPDRYAQQLVSHSITRPLLTNVV